MEHLLKLYFDSIYTNGERFLKARGLFFMLQLLEGSRKVVLIFLTAILACVLLTACLFSSFFYNSSRPELEFDLFNGVMLIISLFCILYLYLMLQEKRWLRAFKLKEKLQPIIYAYESENVVSPSEKPDDALERKILEIVDKRLQGVEECEPRSNTAIH